jgi:ectoine hydroxylase-related dioxygenase (phytanoyl-CoA dioxygenase family)
MRDAFDRDGYVVARRLLQPADIAMLRGIVDRVHAQWLAENRADYERHALINMHSLTRPEYFEGRGEERLAFFRAILPGQLTALVEGLFGEGIYFHNTQLFFNPFEGRRLPYWHRDMQYSEVEDAVQQREQPNMLSLHVRMPLTPEKGVELIPGSHERWDTEIERKVRLELNGHRNNEDLPGAELIDLEPGDVLIFSAQMLHRGNYRLNELRLALDLCVGKAHPLLVESLDESVLPTAGEMARLENNGWYKAAMDAAIRKRTNPSRQESP